MMARLTRVRISARDMPPSFTAGDLATGGAYVALVEPDGNSPGAGAGGLPARTPQPQRAA
jgi:hypothetical protein